MSSVKVIDLNEEVAQDDALPEPIEEAPEEATDPVIDTANEVIEEAVEQPVETPAETPVPKAKPKAKPKASDLVNCPDCSRTMTYKNLRYSHKCSPEPPPVKKQSKPKGKAKPKPVPVPVYEDVYCDEEEDKENIPPRLSAPVNNQVFKPNAPVNPLMNIQQHYQLLQNEYIKQKQEKYNKLCSNMFSTKSKKIMQNLNL